MRSLVLLIAITGCGPGTAGNGTVQIFIAAEDTIPNGLDAGSGEDNIVDGWQVRYDKFLVTVGNFRAWRSISPDDRLNEPRVWVLDMKALPTAGFVLATFTNASDARYDKVGFDLQNTPANAMKAEVTSQADFAMMQANRYSVYFEATLEKAGARTITVK